MRIAPPDTGDEARLAEIEGRLANQPDSVDLQFRRACALEDLGWSESASAAYRRILEAEPQHLGARTNLGLMMQERGDLGAARTLLAAAVAHHPLAPIAHVNLAGTLFELREIADAFQHYGHALALAPNDFAANHGIALVYEWLGDRANAERSFARAFADRAWWTLPYHGTGTPLRVLLLVSGRGGDIIAHPFLDDRTIETTMLVPDGVPGGTTLPPHDVAFNGIGDADRCHGALVRARALLAASPVRAINDPARVLQTGRARVAERIGAIAGVVAPRIARMARAAITAGLFATADWPYPAIVRAPGYHAGRFAALVTDDASLAAALAAIPGDELYVSAFVDTRDGDGMLRKYRVLFVGGRMLPVHLAISRDWMVHYFSAQMHESAAFRDEERRFLADANGVLGSAVVAALQAVGAVLDLDYGGIDFGIDAAGRVVVFEANATMAVAPPDRDARWAYRRPAYEAVVAAVRDLIAERGRATRDTEGAARE